LALTKKITYLLLSLLMAGFMFFSCEKDIYNNSGSAKLAFSTDTVMFDTIFTTLGSTTQSFRVINPTNQKLLISTIKLAGGNDSPYRLNIDGEMVDELSDLEILGNDSIYIFVEITVDPNGVNQPMIVQDSVVFKVNGNLQDVDLIAYGQDVVLLNGEITTPLTLTGDKPYLVFDSLVIKEKQILTIEPGARIHFHQSAYFRIDGAVKAIGTFEQPIVFQGDRLEEMYDDVPEQWYGILIFPSHLISKFVNVEIKNAFIGLQVGVIEVEGSANVELKNVKIQHMSYAGLFCLKSNVTASNTLVADCGRYGVTMIAGGYYSFTHCTVANYWGSVSHRGTPSVYISNQLYVEYLNTLFIGDLSSTWENSIIYGNLSGSEVVFGDNGQNAFDVNFDHCLVKVSDSIFNANVGLFTEVLREADIRHIDSLFFDINNYNFMPDSLSQLRDYGLRSYAERVPFDLGNNSRLVDEGPDIGAYEYIHIEKKEEKE
jgi:hypothetical protein